MNRTLIRNILRMIKATRSRFFSLTAIVALGVAFFIGVYSSSTVMDKSVDYYDDETNLKDITIYSNYGFREEDIEAIEELDCIEKAEGSYFVDVIASQESVSRVTRVHSYSDDKMINSFVLTEGRMPENEHEALSESGTTMTRGFAIGTTVKLSRPDDDLDSYMNVDEVTIVGMIDTPVYMNMTKENSTLSNRPITTYLYVPESAFDCDYYLEADAIAVNAKEYDTFKDPYYEYMDSVTEEVKSFALSQQDENFNAIKQNALEEYNDGLRSYREAEDEFNTQIFEAEQKLEDAEKEISDGRKTLEDSIAQLNAAEQELASQETSAREQIASGRKQIEDGLKQLDEGISQLEDLKTQRQNLTDARTQIRAAEQQLLKAEALLSLVPDDMTVSDLLAIAGEDNDLETQLNQLSSDAANMTAGELLALVEETLKTLSEAAGQVDDGLTQIDSALAEYGSDSEIQEMKDCSLETERMNEENRSLAKDIALLEVMQELLPEEYDAVNIELLIEYHDEIFDLFERIPFEVSIEAENLSEAADAAFSLIERMESETEDEEIIKNLETIREKLNEIKDAVPDALMNMNFTLYSVYGRNIVDAVDALELNEDGSIRTLGDLRNAVAVSLEEKQNISSENTALINEKETRAQTIAENIIDRKVNELEVQRKDVQSQYSTLDEAEETLTEQLVSGRQQISDGWAEVEKGRQTIADGEAELADGYAELEKAKAEGQQQLDEAWQKLLDAKVTIDSLESGEWTVLNRKQHYATVTYDATIDQMAAIGRIFPFFFLMVAVLVCLTTMARTVDEQRGEIGVLRALGYSRMQCAGKYLIYSASATLIGELIGVAAGMATFPIVIYNTWKMMYILPAIKLAVQWDLVLLTDAAFLVVMLITTWFACSADMNDVPAQLLRPKSPKLGKNMFLEKITFIWKRISFTWKVTIRNLFRYKGRFIMTVCGVAGCTALLITGFGIKDSITGMVETHFNQIVQYDGIASVKDELTNEETDRLCSEIGNRDDVDFTMTFYSFTSDCYGQNESSDSVKVQVFENSEDIFNCYDLRTRKKHIPVELTNDGAVISEKLAERTGAEVGDCIEIEDEEGRKHTIKVAAITEMYIQHYVFMTLDYYQSVTGEVPVSRSIALRAADSEQLDDLKTYLADDEGIDGIEFYDTTLERFNTMVKSLNLIVWTIIAASMALAFVVLGNLINVNISERQREIATLKVLGFRRNEVQSYIYKENNILTFLGSLAGIPLGIWLHRTIMLKVEMDYVMFGRSVTSSSMLTAVVLTVFFGILVNYSMRRRLHNIKMVESLKSVE